MGAAGPNEGVWNVVGRMMKQGLVGQRLKDHIVVARGMYYSTNVFEGRGVLSRQNMVERI